MRLNSKSILRWVITLSLLLVIGTLPVLTKAVRAHGPELGGEGENETQKKEEKGPHGGQVVVFGENHLEFNVDHKSGEITLFLLDKDLKAVPMPEDYSCAIYLTLVDGTKKTLTLARGAEGPVPHLEVDTGIKEIGPLKAVISMNMDNKRENFRFSWAPAAHGHEKE